MEPHRFGVRVYFEDTDFSGRVYHGAYVRFLERGRTEMLRAAGLDHATLAASAAPVYFTLRRLDLVFRGPAVIDDWLTVETASAAPVRASLHLHQRILRNADVLVEARVELCLIDGAGRPQRPPAAIREAFQPPGAAAIDT